MKARVTFLLVIWQLLTACTGGNPKDSSESSDSTDSPTTNDTATKPPDASSSISSPIVNITASDPAIISGCNLVFQIDPTKSDLMMVSGYVVGYPETFKVEPQSVSGTYIIKNVPEGEQDIIITGAMARPPESTAQDDSTVNPLGIRMNGLQFIPNQTVDKGKVDLPRSGSIKGVVKISDRPRCDSLVDIGIPGTTIPKVTCNASGEYEMLNIPVGVHGLKVSRKGYKTVNVPKVDVPTDNVINVPIVTLYPEKEIPGLVWTTIPGGKFEMGSNLQPIAQPPHDVRVPEFQMAKTEVTVAQYQACVKQGGCDIRRTAGGCKPESTGYSEYPADCVRWDQAVKFCKWAGGRLPSEAEWEYAARGGGQDILYPWGPEAPDSTRAVYNGVATNAVCRRELGNTKHGLCDMAGNVAEWVQDVYHNSYQLSATLKAPDDGSAWESPASLFHIRRGGSALNTIVDLLRASYRDTGKTEEVYTGFRCARDL